MSVRFLLVHEDLNFFIRVLVLNDYSIGAIGTQAMVSMEQFGGKVSDRLDSDVSGNNYMFDFRILVVISSVDALEVGQSQQVIGQLREHDEGNEDDANGPDAAVPRIGVDISVPYCDKRYDDEVNGVMQI